ncbi:triose-phosphate isomerase [Curtobacterium sp. MCBD17_013]|uniref:triose-phosphate isomerase n=1 Tax=Curtobacterium sp. MCBD17_013 TaxID=2175668 RepID=UPI002814C0D0|nr:triose-phosphate isomerase [Curtobacterium sp. MCBD17_013]
MCDATGPVIVAYEPVWAIGATAPAPDEHIVAVLAGIEAYLASRPELAGSRAIYGGSAGPGLLSRGQGRIGPRDPHERLRDRQRAEQGVAECTTVSATPSGGTQPAPTAPR